MFLIILFQHQIKLLFIIICLIFSDWQHIITFIRIFQFCLISRHFITYSLNIVGTMTYNGTWFVQENKTYNVSVP